MQLKLVPIYEELLTEAVDRDKLINAINNKKLISIYYESPHDKDKPDYPTGWRRIEPFCYGVNNYDNGVLRAWELHGVSYSYPPGKDSDPLTHNPGWRMFRVDGITSINETGNDVFNQPRPKYNPEDKEMKIIYASAKFGTDNNAQPTPSVEPSTPTGTAPAPQRQTSVAPSMSSTPISSVSPTQSSFDSGYTSAFNKTAPEVSQDDATDLNEPEDGGNNNDQPNKPSWFQKFGDKFKNLVNFGKKDSDKI